MCIKKVIPKYIHIQISNSLPSANFTKTKAQNLRIKDELKFLCICVVSEQMEI
jgi:hypothetical protein